MFKIQNFKQKSLIENEMYINLNFVEAHFEYLLGKQLKEYQCWGAGAGSRAFLEGAGNRNLFFRGRV